ncbi:hypothetical protein ACHAXM_004727 [Skeletonema potamos]|jgi:hypothetical protein
MKTYNNLIHSGTEETPSSDFQRKRGVYPTGETIALLKRFDDLRQEEAELSPYYNAPWDVNKEFDAADFFQGVVMLLALVPQLLILYPILFVVLLPPVFVNLLYITFLVPRVCDTIPRTFTWRLHCILQALLSIPSAVLALISLSISTLCMCLFGSLYCTFDSGGWSRYRRNMEVIKPFCGGPSLYNYFSDCIAACAGMVYRRGVMEFTSAFALMFIINPWIKYWITGNVYTADLGIRYVTQVGRPMDDLALKQVKRNFRHYISRAKNTRESRLFICNPLLFCPHFPYPARRSNRYFAVGLEHSTIAAFVHTTHFKSKSSLSDEGGKSRCLSRSAAEPIYRVILWRNNPYHIYTGVVEACISKKRQSLEHPMWLISSHNKLSADPKICLSTGWIDLFFDQFIPHFEYFIRLNELGREAADAMAGSLEEQF